MKKAVCILLLGVLVLTGCESEKKVIELKMATISPLTTDGETVFSEAKPADFGEFEVYENENAKSSKSKKVNGEKISGTYEYSYDDPYVNYDVNVYIDDKGNTFEVNATDDSLVGYRSGEGLLAIENFSTEEELIASVASFAGEYIDTDEFEAYVNTQIISYGDDEMSSRDEEGFCIPTENEEASYIVTYVYIVDGIKTFEKFEINICGNQIESFFYTLPGVFSDSKVEFSLSEVNVEESFEDFVIENTSETIEDLEYEIVDNFLSVDENGEYYIFSIIDLSYTENGNEAEGIESLVIELE